LGLQSKQKLFFVWISGIFIFLFFFVWISNFPDLFVWISNFPGYPVDIQPNRENLDWMNLDWIGILDRSIDPIQNSKKIQKKKSPSKYCTIKLLYHKIYVRKLINFVIFFKETRLDRQVFHKPGSFDKLLDSLRRPLSSSALPQQDTRGGRDPVDSRAAGQQRPRRRLLRPRGAGGRVLGGYPRR
jgi:hypothetical protein